MAEPAATSPPQSSRLVDALRDAARRSAHETYEVLIEHLADAVEFRHRPPVAALDGIRSRADSAAYLRLELVAFPRAFRDDLTVTFAAPEIDGDWVHVPEVHWAGTLLTTGRTVDIGMGLALLVNAGEIVVIEGTVLTSTLRDDLVAWLKAVAAAGGFEPGSARPAQTFPEPDR